MNAIILPGNSISNQRWVMALRETLLSVFKTIHAVSYEHWLSGAPIVDIGKELGRLFLGDEEKIIVESPYAIIAKSAGVLIATRGIFQGRLMPEKCVFIGSAIPWGEEIGCPVWTWFDKFKPPAFFIQNTHDSVMGSKELRHFLIETKAVNWQLHELLGNDHDYSNIGGLAALIKQFVVAE